jgi:uncharacterized protein
VVVEDIPEGGLSLEVDSRDATLLELLGEVSRGSAGPVAGFATMTVEPWPHRLDVRGTLEAKVPMQCVRCLDGYVQELERAFTQILARSPRRGEEEEPQLSRVDLDRSLLVGDVLDLRAVLREELILSVPTKPLCREDCRGICQGCGAELNDAECTCAPEIDERWTALAALKARLSGN